MGILLIARKLFWLLDLTFSLMEENVKKLCSRTVSYSIVTKPIKNLKWNPIALFQDDEDPYHYFRVLPDNRLIFGGEDTKFNLKPINQNLARKKI